MGSGLASGEHKGCMFAKTQESGRDNKDGYMSGTDEFMQKYADYRQAIFQKNLTSR